MQEFTVYAPAKLNLYLDVLDKRADGYHNIRTLFEKIDLKDKIIIKEKSGERVTVKVEPQDTCPSGENNIVYKAIKRLLEEAGKKIGLEVIIKKHIPISAGLGGGSSDAASVLRGLNERFDLGVSHERLFLLANEIGKDVPFFMHDVSFAIATKTGELLEPIDTKVSFSHVVIKPDIDISTKEMYERLEGQLEREKNGDFEKIIKALKKEKIEEVKSNYYNIFEEVLADYTQYIEKAKSLLFKTGREPGFLSGSGPSVFCTVRERKEAEKILDRIPKEERVRAFLATTYKGGIYGNKRGQDIPQGRIEQ